MPCGCKITDIFALLVHKGLITKLLATNFKQEISVHNKQLQIINDFFSILSIIKSFTKHGMQQGKNVIQDCISQQNNLITKCKGKFIKQFETRCLI